MTPTIIEDARLRLPEGIALVAYDENFLVVQGMGLTREHYRDIKAALPTEIQGRLAGWRKLEGRRR